MVGQVGEAIVTDRTGSRCAVDIQPTEALTTESVTDSVRRTQQVAITWHALGAMPIESLGADFTPVTGSVSTAVATHSGDGITGAAPITTLASCDKKKIRNADKYPEQANAPDQCFKDLGKDLMLTRSSLLLLRMIALMSFLNLN